MRIRLNGEMVDAGGSTLDEILKAHGYADAVVATAVNGAFVTVDDRVSVKIEAGDSVEVLAPMQGG
ncbi:MAG: sulfur carrier protein ThiS [Pseudomonadota bacterium]